MFQLSEILRENIKKTKPYSSARDEYKGKYGIFLDANENAYGSASDDPYNRYPDPLQLALKEKISALKRIPAENIFLGNGSDEPIDLIIRAVCEPGKDSILILPPTYGMYEVSANINNVRIIEAPLTEEFQVDVEKVLKAVEKTTKVIFFCSPNNPTGNALRKTDVLKVLEKFNGLVVVDEAYIDFAPDKTFMRDLLKYPNMVILQTFSKAWGLAALRLGMAFASTEVISVLNKIKPPYNINQLTQDVALTALDRILKKEKMVAQILDEREKLAEGLKSISSVVKVYPSDANFLLVKMTDGNKAYEYLIDNKIITRNRSNVKLCESCLRITIGTSEENQALAEALKKFN